MKMYKEFYGFRKLNYIRGNALPKLDYKDRTNDLFDKEQVGVMLKRDLGIRIYAHWVQARMAMDSTRKAYCKALRNWKPGQMI